MLIRRICVQLWRHDFDDCVSARIYLYLPILRSEWGVHQKFEFLLTLWITWVRISSVHAFCNHSPFCLSAMICFNFVALCLTRASCGHPCYSDILACGLLFYVRLSTFPLTSQNPITVYSCKWDEHQWSYHQSFAWTFKCSLIYCVW